MSMSFIQWLSYGGDYVVALAAVVSGCTIVAGALFRLYRAYKKPIDNLEQTMSDRIDKLEAQHEGYDRQNEHTNKCLANDKKDIDALKETNKLLLRGQMQMITHTLDGDHIDQLEQVRDDMHDFLISK